MKLSIDLTRNTLGRLFLQRCFYLFISLLAFIAAAPFIDDSPHGVLVRNAINIFIIVSAVAAVGRSTGSFIIIVLLAAPAMLLRWLSFTTDDSNYFDVALRMNAAMYAAAIAFLMRYVFDREVMDSDRLWGAAACFLLLGVLWCFLYAIVDRMVPDAYLIRGSAGALDLTDLVYFSFSTLTTTGFGDIVPIARIAKVASVLEAVIGQLFLAILIARLVGVYPVGRGNHQNGAVS
ncbi:hypothetical protein HNQ60_004047 [Povalibacter uvarum]|uniref:Potassium channel domain-containing protein n=1 Tax=Povalibacter uvarum TaxID=732238 RepID=A0A841HPQ9_9GAMM|nr:potassium channel family protein [Povalibacter uvarum]MBB6095157.1 hypothetical protein [Povalibacter uvarum]